MEWKAVIIGIIVLAAIGQVRAAPTLDNLTIQPDLVWMGSTATISAQCADTVPISSVTALVSGPTIILPPLSLTLANGVYTTSVDNFYLSETGAYAVTLVCMSSSNENATLSGGFSVSVLNGNITAVIPQPAFVGETFEIDVLVKKDGVAIAPPDSMNFSVTLDGVSYPLQRSPPYDSTKGWHLYLNSPSSSGTYQAEVTAEYKGATFVQTTQVRVERVIDFSVIALDKTWFTADREIIASVRANEKGLPVNLQPGDIDIVINGVHVSVDRVSQNGDLFDVAFRAPAQAPGFVDANFVFTYKGTVLSDTERVQYVIPITATFFDQNSDPIATTLVFTANGTSDTFTAAGGKVDGLLPRGTYEVQVKQPSITATFKNTIVNSFSDPLTVMTRSDIDVPGLNVRGFGVIDAALAYDKIVIEAEYSGQDATGLNVYQCRSWEFDTHTCTGTWDRIDATLDKAERHALFTIATRGAFAIGTPRTLSVQVTIEKPELDMGESLHLTGAVLDDGNAHIAGATVMVDIQNEGIHQEATSDKNGIFTMEIVPPQREDSFTLVITPQLSPFTSTPTEKQLSVVKRKELYLVVPENVRVSQGKTETIPMTITNLGQSAVELSLVITGLPSEFLTTIPAIGTLEPGEDRKVEVTLTVPADANIKTYSSSVVVKGADTETKKTLPITILEAGEPQAAAQIQEKVALTHPSFSLPSFDPTGLVTAVEGVVSVESLAVLAAGVLVVGILRRKKTQSTQRRDVVMVLNDIKREIHRLEEE